MDPELSTVKYFFAGGFGGTCTVLVGHPFDTIKVRLQTMPLPKPGEKPMYNNTWDCAKKIVKTEGLRGLYKGIGPPLVGVSPIFALSFSGYSLGKTMLKRLTDKPLTKFDLFCAGAFSGVFTTVIMTPGERVKCLLQVQQETAAGRLKYSGGVDVIKSLYKEGGIRSLYRGTIATLLRDVPASGMYFMTYETIKEWLTPEGGKASMGATVLAGGTAGMFNWCVGIPSDVIKSRLQSAPDNMYPGGMKEVFCKLMKEEGPRALYKGCTPVMIRAFPANAACFFGFEVFSQLLNWLFPVEPVDSAKD